MPPQRGGTTTFTVLRLGRLDPLNAPSGEPRVTISLTASDTPTATQATYSYRITPHTSDVGKVMAVLTLTNEGGHWLVTTFDEREGPPTS